MDIDDPSLPPFGGDGHFDMNEVLIIQDKTWAHIFNDAVATTMTDIPEIADFVRPQPVLPDQDRQCCQLWSYGGSFISVHIPLGLIVAVVET